MKYLLLIASLITLSISAGYAEQAGQGASPPSQESKAAATPEAQSSETSASSEAPEKDDANKPAQASAQEQKELQIHLEGDKGHFKLKPGTTYHWHSTSDEANGKSKYYRKKLRRDFTTDSPQQDLMDDTPATPTPDENISNATTSDGAVGIQNDPSPPVDNPDMSQPIPLGN